MSIHIYVYMYTYIYVYIHIHIGLRVCHRRQWWFRTETVFLEGPKYPQSEVSGSTIHEEYGRATKTPNIGYSDPLRPKAARYRCSTYIGPNVMICPSVYPIKLH